MKIKIIFFLILFFGIFGLVKSSWAAIINVQSCQQSAVQTAIDGANSGDTINVPACNITWSGAINFNEKITLKGAGKSLTLINGGSINMSASGSRVSGFGFTNTTVSVDGDGWRIDNNNFTYSNRTLSILASGNRSNSHPTGVIDNNYFIKAGIIIFGYCSESGPDSSSGVWALPAGLGSGDNVVYLEDNTFTSGQAGVYSYVSVDSNCGARYVFRYNTVINSDISNHGIQSNNNRGSMLTEIYNNSFTTDTPFYNAVLFRSGTGMIYENTIGGSYTLNFNIDNQTSTRYGDYSCNNSSYPSLRYAACDGNNPRDGNTGSEGYPCRDQIGRGRDLVKWSVGQPFNQSYSPLYIWNNIKSGSDISLPTITAETPIPCQPSNSGRYLLHLVANRDFYFSSGAQVSQASPFSGTSGVGYGTLARRPVTCKTSIESGGGVAYWATDTKTLYKCTTDNVWTAFYTPYTYPHPLRNENGGGDTIPPAAPINLIIQ